LQNIEQQWCDICHRSISGGDANFLSHQTSKAHKIKAKESVKKKPTAITKFFKPEPSTAISARVVGTLSSQSSTKDVVIDIDSIQDSPVPGRAITIPGPSDSHFFQPEAKPTLLTRLHTLAVNLPLSIPIGSQDEPLGCFAVNPKDLILADQDAWEDVIDPMFNQVIGFGKSTLEIAAFIRRGEYGMDGFCKWTAVCVEQLGIPLSLLEMRLERVIQAMIHVCVSIFYIIRLNGNFIFQRSRRNNEHYHNPESTTTASHI
jgi:hypothetical protein